MIKLKWGGGEAGIAVSGEADEEGSLFFRQEQAASFTNVSCPAPDSCIC